MAGCKVSSKKRSRRRATDDVGAHKQAVYTDQGLRAPLRLSYCSLAHFDIMLQYASMGSTWKGSSIWIPATIEKHLSGLPACRSELSNSPHPCRQISHLGGRMYFVCAAKKTWRRVTASERQFGRTPLSNSVKNVE